MALKKDKNIFLINICKETLMLIQLILENQEYTVTSISNNSKKFNNIYKALPYLIILELMTSYLDEINIIHSLKINHYLSHIPILLLTNKKNIQLEEMININEVCYKPFEIEYLLSKIKLLLLCQENFKTSTFIINVDNEDPLMRESQELQSILDTEPLLALEIFQQQGYEIGIS